MKAVIYTKYGPPNVLKVVEVEKPQPKDNEILVKICATTVTSGDVRLRSSNFPLLVLLPVRLMFGLFKPKKEILGHEFSGIVEAVGKDVTKYKIGEGAVVICPPGSISFCKVFHDNIPSFSQERRPQKI